MSSPPGSTPSAVESRPETAAPAAPAPDAAAPNPLLLPWPGPFGGVPPFDRIRVEHFPPALEAALAERRREVAAIRGGAAAPTFANTIEALERAGATYDRVAAIYSIFSNGLRTDAFAALEREWAPRLAAAADEIALDAALFARVEAVWTSAERERLGAEQQRLLWRTYDGFVRAGARLDAARKERLAAINQELASLYTELAQKVQADEATCTVLEFRDDLAGLPEPLVAALAAAAAERGLAGKWAVANIRSMVDPFLTLAARRDLRERVWRAFKSRGDNGDANDTKATIARILPLRAEKARLLGYPTFADWKVADKMAKTPQRAMELMLAVWEPTVERVRGEVADLLAVARREDPALVIEPWDYLYYAEKVRREKHDLDEAALVPYLQLEQMIAAGFWMAGRLYGLSFLERTGELPVFHPDVRVWEVRDAGGRTVGLFYGDYFARAGKSSGAWEHAYRPQSRLDGEVLPLVSNNFNFARGAPGEPVLISLDDAETLFHELGHALHDLLSSVTYERLAGTNTAIDFVELPPQLHEHWLLVPELLDRFARHVSSGEPMPAELVAKVRAARTFNQGYATAEYLAAAIVDLEIHATPAPELDVGACEREVLARIGMPREVALRHRLPHFLHLFSGESYAAGYYGYLWSDVMSADAWAAFEEVGDPWDAGVAARLAELLASGDAVEPEELYRRFRGREPSVAALLAERGLVAAAGRE